MLLTKTNKITESKIMEQETAAKPTTEKAPSLTGTIIKWLFLVLIVATCLMAAYRKFGG